MILSLNVYLYNMYMGVKKNNFVYVMKMIVKNVFDIVYVVLIYEEIVV